MTRVRIVALLFASSCVLEPVKLGEQEDDGGAGASLPTTADSGDTAEPTSTGGIANGIGAPCWHDLPAGEVPESRVVTFPALDCDGLVCVYADVAEAPMDTCDEDVDCNAADPFANRFECVPADGECRLSQDYVAARSFCSSFCETSDECADAEPSNCVTGFDCVVLAAIGSAGCRGVCACNDDVDAATATELRQDCIDGIAPACGEHPGQGLCP